MDGRNAGREREGGASIHPPSNFNILETYQSSDPTTVGSKFGTKNERFGHFQLRHSRAAGKRARQREKGGN
jgi:hypothetical protein